MPHLETIAGRILYVGPSTFDKHCHTYSTVEMDTSAGRVDLTSVMAANELDRVIKPGRDIAMTVVRHGKSGNGRVIVFGAYDADQRRTFVNEELFKVKAQARKQAVLYSLMSIIVLPVGLTFFVLPGLIWLRLVWLSWASIGHFATPEEIRQSVAALSSAKAATI